MRYAGRQAVEDPGISGAKTRLVIDDQQHVIGLCHGLPGALHPGPFDRIGTVVQAGRVDDVQRHAIELDVLAQAHRGWCRVLR